MDRGSIEIMSNINSRQMNLLRCYQEFVDGKKPWWIEKLSRIHRPEKNFLDGSRICQEAIETNSRKFRWIEDAIRSTKKKKSKGSIDSYLLRSVEKLSSLIKTVFWRGEKHRNECNQACYSTKDPNNILSSQKHLSTRKMWSIKDPNTHTHTHIKQV